MRITLLFAALAVSAPVAAKAPAVHVSGWARATVPGQSSAAVYLSLHNAGPAADRLLSVSSPAATSASVHNTTHVGGVVRMRSTGPLTIAAGQAVTMKPGGLHVMLTGLKAPLKTGQRVPLTLRFERAGTVRATLPVQLEASGDGHAH